MKTVGSLLFYTLVGYLHSPFCLFAFYLFIFNIAVSVLASLVLLFTSPGVTCCFQIPMSRLLLTYRRPLRCLSSYVFANFFRVAIAISCFSDFAISLFPWLLVIVTILHYHSPFHRNAGRIGNTTCCWLALVDALIGQDVRTSSHTTNFPPTKYIFPQTLSRTGFPFLWTVVIRVTEMVTVVKRCACTSASAYVKIAFLC